mgnify:CR=1 FL=1
MRYWDRPPEEPVPELVAIFKDALSRGHSIKSVCLRTGISEGVYYRWKAKGRDENAPPAFRLFHAETERARGYAEGRLVDILWSDAAMNAKAAMYLLDNGFAWKWGGGHDEDEAGKRLRDAKVAQAEANVRLTDARIRSLENGGGEALKDFLEALRDVNDHDEKTERLYNEALAGVMAESARQKKQGREVKGILGAHGLDPKLRGDG